ncbi:MAG: hypothetical protein JST89_14175 [Cyanobacteria bacterium SZAS-4]|nr:hypothetical protein [Cyanobacteria bacterium SZAS-4]
MPSPTLETSDRFPALAQFTAEDQSTAVSIELLKISQQTPSVEQKPLSASTDQTVDQAAPRSPNVAVDKLPSLSVEQTAKTEDAKVGSWTNTFLDIGFGTAAVVATEAALGVLTKNPRFEAMALETLQSGGKFALMTSPKFVAPFIAATGLGYGTATVGRHFAVEGLTSNSESWMDSANHVGIGAATFMASRYLGNKFSAPVAPKA